MTVEELADLIRANSANTNGRIDSMRNETNAQLMNIQNDLTDVKGDLTDVKRSLDLVETVSNLQPLRHPLGGAGRGCLGSGAARRARGLRPRRRRGGLMG